MELESLNKTLNTTLNAEVYQKIVEQTEKDFVMILEQLSYKTLKTPIK